MVFLVSRLGLGLLAYLSLVLVPLSDSVLTNHASFPRYYPENLIVDGWARWEAPWYRGIAEGGYTNIYSSTLYQEGVDTRFFPLYPLLMGWLGRLTGDTLGAGMLISNVSFWLALVAIYRIASDRFGPVAAGRAIILFCLYPFNVFFAAVCPDSLLLAAASWTFYLGERSFWVGAATCASLASVTCPSGMLVLPALALLYFEGKRLGWDVLLLPLAALLPAAHLFQMWRQFRNPWVFLPTSDQLLGGLFQGGYPGSSILAAAAMVGGLLGSCLALSRLNKAYGFWGLAVLLIGAFTWPSMGRVIGLLFPVSILAGAHLPDWLFGAVAFTSTLLLCLMVFMFSHWSFVG